MNYRMLGNTDLKVSVVGLGTWQYAGDWGKEFTQEEVKDILGRAAELGFNLIDTAAGYGINHLSESLIGESIKGNRDRWVISTKFGNYRTGKGTDSLVRDFSAKGVAIQLEDSLRALQTDHIDIYLMHCGKTEHIDNDEIWTMLDKAKRDGKVKHFGLSLLPSADENIIQTRLAIKYGCEVIEALYNHLDRSPEDGLFYVCKDNNLGVLARVPLAQGYLSGKYKQGAVFAQNDMRSRYYDDATNTERLLRAEQILSHEVPAGVNPADWSIAWSVKHDAVTACIPGFKSIEQLESGARAAELVNTDHPLSVK